MDLREIQNLHAHYASQPVVIDLAGQVAAAQAIPALPSPDLSDSHSRGFGRLTSAARRHAKPLALAAALAVVAGAAGMGAARLWASLHPLSQHAAAARATLSASPSAAASQQTQAPASGTATVPPLTSADFGATAASAGLATVNTRELLQHAPLAIVPAVPSAHPTGDAARALVSPIHAPRVAAPVAISPGAADARTQTAAPETNSAATVPQRQAAQHEPTATQQPVTTPRHHPRRLRQAPTADASATLAAPVNDHNPAAPAKASDVQLF